MSEAEIKFQNLLLKQAALCPIKNAGELMQKAMEPLKAPINMVSEEEMKAAETLPFFLSREGIAAPPHKPPDVR